MERVAGIEPARQPWEGYRLPLHHTRASFRYTARVAPSSGKDVAPVGLRRHDLDPGDKRRYVLEDCGAICAGRLAAP